MPLFAQSGATPYNRDVYPPISYPWWKFGGLVWPPRRPTRKSKEYLVFYLLVFLIPSAVILVIELLSGSL